MPATARSSTRRSVTLDGSSPREADVRFGLDDDRASRHSLPSLRDYVLVSTTQVLVEHFARQPDGSWLLREHRAGGCVTLSIGVELAVDEVYLKVFAPKEEPIAQG